MPFLPLSGRPAPSWLPMLVALALGGVGGAIASRLGLPLAWMLGPLIACAAASISGVAVAPVRFGRELGQSVVGLAIGLRFNPVVVKVTLSLLPAMVVATLYVIAVTTAAAFLLRPLARVDDKTAFFATAAAGMADMALLAHDRGADADAVSMVHAIRVTAVVTLVPLIVYAFGRDGGLADQAAGATGGPLELAVLLGLGIAAMSVLRPLHFPNPWLIGPMLVGGGAAMLGLVNAGVPSTALVVAQVMIGIALGCRFKRALILRLPRVVGAALVVSALLIAAAALAALPLSAATGLSFAASFLALAPAGVTEMVLTARIMHLDTTSVTAFHVMRIAVITATILLALRGFQRLSRWLDATAR